MLVILLACGLPAAMLAAGLCAKAGAVAANSNDAVVTPAANAANRERRDRSDMGRASSPGSTWTPAWGVGADGPTDDLAVRAVMALSGIHVVCAATMLTVNTPMALLRLPSLRRTSR